MNRVVHFEIHAANMDKLQTFYKSVFGWTFQNMGDKFGGYRVIVTGENKLSEPMTPAMMGINGGMLQRPGPLPTPDQKVVNAYVCIIGVDDVDTVFEKVLSEGGSAAMEPSDVPNVGRLAYCKDPENNVFGIITSTMPPGSSVV